MLIETNDLTRIFKKRGVKNGVHAVSGANIRVDRGETCGLYGMSGSGKSTLGLMVAGLLRPTSGAVLYKGRRVIAPYRREVRKAIQILFQHPEVSFNPVLPLISSMKEPYRVCGMKCSDDIIERDIAEVGLNMEHLKRRPFELSGGELQRAALARALVLKPELIILDEPTSMLDAITQAQIMALLMLEQKKHGTAYILITHNRTLCELLCKNIYDISEGEVTLRDRTAAETVG